MTGKLATAVALMAVLGACGGGDGEQAAICEELSAKNLVLQACGGAEAETQALEEAICDELLAKGAPNGIEFEYTGGGINETGGTGTTRPKEPAGDPVAWTEYQERCL